MKDVRLIKCRTWVLRQPHIDPAVKLLMALIYDWVYTDPDLDPDYFPCPWSRIARWTGIAKRDTVYAWFAAAQKCGLLIFREVKLSPPTRHYSLILDAPINGRSFAEGRGKVNAPAERGIDAPAERGIIAPVERMPNAPAERGNPISNPFRKELSPRESNGSAVADKASKGDSTGSLRSQREPVGQAQPEPDYIAALRQAVATSDPE